MKNTLHIYNQRYGHETADIVGTKEGLIRLRDAINVALESDLARADVFANDGEGYYAIVALVDDKQMEEMRLPYDERPICWHGKNLYETIGKEKYGKLIRP